MDVIDRAEGLFGVPGVFDLAVGVAGIQQAPQPDAATQAAAATTANMTAVTHRANTIMSQKDLRSILCL